MGNKKTKTGKGRLDKYYHLAKDQGYRARSAFKLIQLAKKFDFLSKSKICLDLCAAPGGWSQVAQRNMPVGSQILAIDLAPIKALPGVVCIMSDITTEKCRSLIRKELKGAKADIVLNDGAPNVGASWSKDAFSQAELTLHAMKLACDTLKPGGHFITKVFRSADYNSLLWVFNQLFNKVDATKPTASRNVSAEIFVMCIGFKAGKIDPRFYDPKWVFMEALDPINQDDGASMKAGAKISEHMKNLKKRHRSGYEEGDDLRIVPAHEFISSHKPAEVLIAAHRLNLEAPGCEPLKENPLTTEEIVDLCNDLKVLGKKDLGILLKWRMRVLRETEKVERAHVKAEKEEATTLAVKAKAARMEAKKAAVAKAAFGGLDPDVDDAIAELLDGADGGAAATGPAVDISDSDDEEEDDRLEKELSTEFDKRRREERREGKRLMERQKKQELRKKMSLGGGRKQVQDHPELFRATVSSVKALEDAGLPVDFEDEDSEDEAGFAPEESESDDEMDRLARMEIDLAIMHEIGKGELADKCRNASQRMDKRKKETRRQRVHAAWAGEMGAFTDSIQDKASAHWAMKDQQEAESNAEEEDSDDDLQELRAYQKSLEAGKGSAMDGDALSALADGPDFNGRDAAEEVSSEEEGAGPGPKRKRARLKNEANETALAVVEEDEEESLRDQHRASRWFSQDIFQGLSKSSGSRSTAVKALDHDEEDSNTEDSDDETNMRELSDAQLPKLPLTDKEKRKNQRKKEMTRLQKMGIKPKQDEAEKGRMEVAPLEAPKPLVTMGKYKKPSDPRELAETMALGSLLVESKKSRMELIDAAYNRWTFDPNEALPVWFTEEEEKYNKPELPITKELMDQFRAKLREINARPIRKVAEARARKKRRLTKKLEKLRSTAMSLSEASDMSNIAKARQMRKAVNKMAKDDERKVTTVAIKKSGGGHQKAEKGAHGKIPSGAKTKVVDRRMKSDRRGLRKAFKRDPSKKKAEARKAQMKLRRGKRRGKGDKGDKGGGKKEARAAKRSSGGGSSGGGFGGGSGISSGNTA